MDFIELVKSRIKELAKKRDEISMNVERVRTNDYKKFRKQLASIDDAIAHNRKILIQLTGVH